MEFKLTSLNSLDPDRELFSFFNRDRWTSRVLEEELMEFPLVFTTGHRDMIVMLAWVRFVLLSPLSTITDFILILQGKCFLVSFLVEEEAMDCHSPRRDKMQ